MSYVQQFWNDKENEWLGPDGCHYESDAELLAIGVFNLCGCSDEYESFKVIRDTLTHFNEWREKNTYWNDLVKTVFNGVEGAAYLVCGLIDDKFIEHGTAIRGSWLTDEGKALLVDLNRIINQLDNQGSTDSK